MPMNKLGNWSIVHVCRPTWCSTQTEFLHPSKCVFVARPTGSWISLAMLRPARGCLWTITAPFRRRSALAILPRTSTVTLGPPVFYSSGSVLWNCLPTELRHPDLTLGTFKRKLEDRFCFCQWRSLDLVTMRVYVTYLLTVRVEMSVYLLTYLLIILRLTTRHRLRHDYRLRSL